MKLLVDGTEVEFGPVDVEVTEGGDRLYVRTANGTSTAAIARRAGKTLVSYLGRTYEVERPGRRPARSSAVHDGELRAAMPGVIVEVLVTEGDEVKAGQKLAVLEAMKTQQPISAPFDGTVTRVTTAAGSQVAEGELLAVVEP